MITSGPRLTVQGLTKSFFGVKVLDDVSFEAQAGRVLAVVGENGSGKSTTMNLLTGVLRRDSGTVLLDGRPLNPRSRRESDEASIAFIQQELNIFPNLTVAENLFLVRPPRVQSMLPFISRQRMHEMADNLLRRVDLEVSTDVSSGTLSTGQRQLVEIARGLAWEAKVFIFDEPTSSLTAREAAKLFEVINRLRQQCAAILYISHNLDEVLSVSDDVMVLRDGKVTLRQECKNMTANDLVLAMVGRPIDALFPQRASTRPEPTPVLDIEAITELGVLNNINLRVGRGEIVGIAGLMGSGRSELARAIFGLDHYDAGVVRISGKQLPPGDVQARLAAGMAFLTEDRRHEGLMMDASVADNMALAALPNFTHPVGKRIDRGRLVKAIADLMTRLNVKSGDAKSTPVRSLSGGNQQKVVLGRWLLRNPSVFILDEPTRGVDIGAKQEIYRLLAQLADAGMAILVISSELEELIGTCDRIHVMRQGALSAEFPRERFDREVLLRAAFGQSYAA